MLKVRRPGDMGEKVDLQLLLEDDGDVIISILPKGHRFSMDGKEIQFSVSGTMSHNTVIALHALYRAMLEDSKQDNYGTEND